MLFHNILAVVLFSSTAHSIAVEKAVVYVDEGCKGKALVVEPDNSCTLLPGDFRKKINAAKVPEGVVCDFYKDEKCKEPLWIGMEDPGECRFTELEIENKAASVRCYDDTERNEM